MPEAGAGHERAQFDPTPLPLLLLLEVGSGRLLTLPAPATTVLAADPRVARVHPDSPTSIFVYGIAAGRTTVTATGEDGTLVAEYAVTVRNGGRPNRPRCCLYPADTALARYAGRRSGLLDLEADQIDLPLGRPHVIVALGLPRPSGARVRSSGHATPHACTASPRS